MAIPGRQIEGVTGETLVTDLARAAIEQRLAAVVSRFPLAATDSIDDHESVHQLRVSTRRAVAALELFGDFCPPRRKRRLLKHLKRIRRAAGAGRDLDVFTTRLATFSSDAHQVLLPDLMASRQAAQEELVRLYHRLTDDHCISEEAAALTKKVRPRGKQTKRRSRQLLSQWAPRRLRKAVNRFQTAVPATPQQIAELHELRIEGKRLRYTLELLSAGLPEATYNELYQLLEEMQDRLGAINDHQVAVDRLQLHLSADDAIGTAIERESAAMEQEVAAVQGWIREDFLPRLEVALDGARDGPSHANPEAESA